MKSEQELTPIFASFLSMRCVGCLSSKYPGVLFSSLSQSEYDAFCKEELEKKGYNIKKVVDIFEELKYLRHDAEEYPWIESIGELIKDYDVMADFISEKRRI